MKTILFLFTTLFSLPTYCQNANLKSDTSELCGDTVFYVLAQPEYPGDIKAIISNFKKSIAFDKTINGQIIISWIVSCRGKAVRYSIRSGINKIVDNLVFDQFKKLLVLNWKPGYMDGKARDVPMSISIKIKDGHCIKTD